MNKSDELKFIVGRYDHLYDSINNKANLYLTLNTFILAGSVGGYASLSKDHAFPFWVFFIALFAMLCSLLSFTFTLLAIRPFTRKHNKEDKEALMFFGDVSKIGLAQWKSNWETANDLSWQQELKTQTYDMAAGLSLKFNRLQVATFFIGLQILSVITFALYLIITKS